MSSIVCLCLKLIQNLLSFVNEDAVYVHASLTQIKSKRKYDHGKPIFAMIAFALFFLRQWFVFRFESRLDACMLK